MKKLILIVVLMPLMALADKWTDPSTGIEWTYVIQSDETVSLGNGFGYPAVSESTMGTLIIPRTINGKSVTSIGSSAFSGCSGLTSVTIPSSVTSIGSSAFSGCSGLTSITLPFVGSRRGNSETSESLFGYIFGTSSYTGGTETSQYYSSSRWKTYYIPSSLKSVVITDETVIGYGAFYDCSGLTSVTISSSVTSIGSSAFSGCSGLKSIYVDSGNTVYCSLNGLLCSKDGKKLIAGVNGNVIIPASVTSIEERAFSGCSGLTSVTIPSSVTSIGRSAFSSCSGLTSVTISEGVTSIGDYAFYDCSGLTSVTIPSSVTSIGSSAFSGCSGLTSITLPFVWSRRGNSGIRESLFGYIFGTLSYTGGTATKQYYSSSYETYYIPSSLKSVVIADETVIGYGAFYDCSGLTSVTIPSSVTSIGSSAFSGCSGLKSIYVDSGNTVYCSLNGLLCSKDGKKLIAGVNGDVIIPSSVTSIGEDAFYGCSGLTSVTIPSSVTSIGSESFKGCSGLTSVTIPSSVTSIGSSAFSGCSGLTSITLPFVGSQRGNSGTRESLFGYIFGTSSYTGGTATKQYYSSSYETYYIPSSLKSVVITDETEIGYGAFYGCSGLTSVTIPSSMTSIGSSAFSGCSGLEGVYISDLAAWCGIKFANSYANPLYYAKKFYLNGKEVIYLDIPNGVEAIGQYAFYNCNRFMTATIPQSVTSIGSSAFYGCTSIKSVSLPETFSVKSVFPSSYGNMTTVTIPANATEIADSAFDGCKQISSIDIPTTVTRIGSCAFRGCSGVTSLIIPVNVTDLGASAFSGCNRIREIVIPEGVGELPASLFEGCSGLTTVTIPNSVTNISSTAFKDCGSVVSVTMPGRFAMEDVFPSSYTKITNVTILEGEEFLQAEVFAGCSALTTVVISEGVTTLGEDLFYNLRNLTELTIPSTVTSIGGYAFYGCSSLKTIQVSNDGDIDALKQMLYESGFDTTGVTFDHVKEPVYTYYTVLFNANGGSVEKTEAEVREGAAVGTLPVAERDGYEFLGWFTSTIGGTKVTAATIVTKDVTFYAHWKRIGVTSDEEVIAGEKVTIETGLVGYKASGLPSGLKYDAKTGKITGTTKNVTAEAVEVVFTKAGEEEVTMTFEVRAEEVSVGCEALTTGSFQSGVMGAAGGIPIQLETETGIKSVSVTKLPSGMKYDSKNRLITGAPNKPGDYEVVLTLTTASGAKETVKIPVSVVAMPVMAVGKFDGFVAADGDNRGTFTLTTTDAGKLTAKVVTAAGTVSFSGTCWDSVEDGVYRTTLMTKKGEKLTLMLDSTAAWDANQLSGEFTTAAIAETKKTAAVPSRTYVVSAQRNAFGKTWYFTATGDETTGWKLAYTEDTKGAALTVTLKADGSISIAGKLPNGTDAKGKAVTIKVSASGYANVGGMRDGAIMADFAPIVTVNKEKTALAITTNLWFDRSNDHAEGVGRAKFVK